MDMASGHEDRRSLSRRSIILAAAPLAGLLLTSCGMTRRGFDYSYRLTLAIDANGATHTDSSVVHVHTWNEQTIDAGWMTQHIVNGEATSVQLGDGRVVVALLAPTTGNRLATWTPTGPLLQAYGIQEPAFSDQESYDAAIDALADARGPRELADKQLPALIAFLRADDPNSAVVLDPGDLSATLGPGVRLRSAEIEVTDSPVTTSIERLLPWFDARGRAESKGLPGDRPPGPDWAIDARRPDGGSVAISRHQLKSSGWCAR